MLSIIVNERGELAYCTTRWNHDNGGSDSSMSAKEVSQVVGVNFYAVFKPNNKWKELIAQVKQQLANGEDPGDVFDWVGDFNEGFAKVKLNGKFNFINQEGQLLSDQWYDWAGWFQDGFVRVKLNEKYNFINQEGQLLSDQWYDWAGWFQDGFVRVRLNGKYYKLDTSGRLHNMNENKGYKTSKKMKKVVRLTESDLHRLIKESVKRILREGKEDEINASWDAYENTFDTYIDGTIPTELDKDNFYPMYHNIGKDKYNTLKTKSEIDYPNEFSTDSKYFKGRNAMEAMDDRFPTTQQMRQNHWRGKAKDGRIN